MPRRALSRQQQAFQALLEPDDIEESDQRRGSQGKGKASSARKFKSMDTKTPGFKLHEAQNESSPGPSGSGGSDLAHLQELFGQTLAHEVIQDVYEACGGSSEATVEALLSMSGGEPAPIRDSEKAEQPSPLATQPANAASHGRDPEQPCFWDLLPEECKLLILDHLSLKELARAAGTCRELAQHVCAQRRSITRIMVPPRLSAVALRGLVAAYIAATEVDLSRCSQSLRFSNEFEDTFKAIAEGAADRYAAVPLNHMHCPCGYHFRLCIFVNGCSYGCSAGSQASLSMQSAWQSVLP